MVTLNKAETSIVLEALRAYQRNTTEQMADALDDICEKINCDDDGEDARLPSRICKHVKHLMYLYLQVKSGVTIFEQRTGLQMLRDALESAKQCGLVKEYCFDGTITFPDDSTVKVEWKG